RALPGARRRSGEQRDGRPGRRVPCPDRLGVRPSGRPGDRLPGHAAAGGARRAGRAPRGRAARPRRDGRGADRLVPPAGGALADAAWRRAGLLVGRAAARDAARPAAVLPGGPRRALAGPRPAARLRAAGAPGRRAGATASWPPRTAARDRAGGGRPTAPP